MTTQTRQDLSVENGFSTPPEIVAYGLQTRFEECMAKAAEAYRHLLQEFPLEAPYVLPLAYRIRVLVTWNLREIFHFVQLRSARQGHFSYRAIAQNVYQEIARMHLLLARYIRVDLAEYPFARS